MTNDDDDKGRKTNADRDHKPAHEARNGYAPRGAEGRPSASGPTPGLGTSSHGRLLDQTSQQTNHGQGNERIQFRKSEDKQADPDKTYVIATGDKDVDSQAAKSDNVVSRERAETMIGKEGVSRHLGEVPEQEGQNEGPRISQSDYAKAFRAARDSTNTLYQRKGQQPD